MSTNESALSSNLSPSQLDRLTQICDRFEATWRAGLRPRITEFMGDAPEPERTVVLRTLLALELRVRRELGEHPTPEDYQREFPGRNELIDLVFHAFTAAGREANGVPTISRNGTDPGPDNQDPTLTYSVGRNGRVVPWIGADQRRRLQVVFAPGVVVQDRYLIDRELGRGGMGVVFLGRDRRLDRPVAIKVSRLQERTYDPDENRLAALRGAFAEEARLGANLTHPSIATVYDYGFHDDNPFTVFEYLPGETLSALLERRKRLPPEEVRLIIGPLTQALDFAHARRVVHRDLKPDNIRATEQGLFKVLDLGLAREFGRDLDWSGFAGTPAYASPEQASGLPCDGRADQYALALIAFELLTGNRLFRASDRYELLKMHCEAEPTALATDLTDVPEAVRFALVRALSKDPNARFTTCGDFALALGCQLLSAPAPAPEILIEADVERMTVGRLVRSMSFPWLTDAVHLALTREALWSAYHTEVRRWPLSDVERIEPRSDPVDEPEAAELASAGVVRRLHRDAEAGIRLVRGLHVIVLVPVLVVLSVQVGLATLGGPSARTWPSLVTIGVLVVLGAWLFAVNLGLRRLRAWSRWAALTESLAAPVMAAGLLYARAAIPRPSALPDPLAEPLVAGLLLSGAIVLATCLAWILFSRKASVLFTPSYRDIVDRTRYLDPRTMLGLDRANQRTLRLKVQVLDDRLARVAFRFPTARECKHWAGRLAALAGRPADPAARGGEPAPAEPTLVVLLRQRPTARYQLLGTVEAKAVKGRTAEAGLQVRAAMIGADSVVDLQEEFLPDFGRTVRRLTGTAVRAVDAEGRFEFRSRWYSNRVAWVSTWALVLLLITFALRVLSSIFISAIEQGRLGILNANARVAPLTWQAVASSVLWQVLWAHVLIAAISVWPTGLAALARCLRWPQFVRPLALTLVAFALVPLYLLTGLVAGALLAGGWSGLLYHSLLLLDPMNLTCLLFGLFLGRAAWRADREFRRLVPDASRKAPPHRALIGGSTLAASVIYAALLACYIIWGGYLDGSQFRLPTALNGKAAAAIAQFEAGTAVHNSDPVRAADHFRNALTLWEDLVRDVPSDLDYQIKLAASRSMLAYALLAQGRLADGREQLMRSAGQWEVLASGPLPASMRAIVDRNRNSIRTVLQSIGSVRTGDRATGPGRGDGMTKPRP